MPPVKPSTIQSASKSKRKRKEQLAMARKCRKIEETAVTPPQVIESERVEPIASTSSSVQPSVNGDLLQNKTRSQFKNESYATLQQVPNQRTCEDTQPDRVDCRKKAVVEVDRFAAIVSKLSCPQCQQCTIVFRTDTKRTMGLAVHADVYCTSCEEIVQGTEGYLSSRCSEGKDFTVNSQAVYSSLVCGLSSSGFNNFCENLDLAGLSHKSFHEKANKLYGKLDELEERVFSQTVEYVRRVHAEQSGITLTDNDILDISVSFDGTWLTRGHSSHIGVGCVVDVLTGMCVDVHTMCTYCQVCETTGKPLFRDKPLEYAAWLVQHLATCDRNFNGSSGMMEVEAAKVLWGRSVDRHKLHYTVLLSDGDAKTYNELCAIEPYGEEVLISKEECINHVSNRLGTALRNIVADCRKKGVTLGGRGRGQLTQNAVKKLQIYYNRAVRNSTTVEEMQKAVMASLNHCYSTDKKPRHELCPTGDNSWCFWQAAVAQQKTPGPHEKLIHTPLNYDVLNTHLEPIYKRLSDSQLLSRCVSGKTQNSNECSHSLIWSRCSKDIRITQARSFCCCDCSQRI